MTDSVLLEVCTIGLCLRLHLTTVGGDVQCICTGTAAGKGRRQVVGRGWDVRRSVLEGAKIGEWFHSADRPSSKHHLTFPT